MFFSLFGYQVKYNDGKFNMGLDFGMLLYLVNFFVITHKHNLLR